MDGAFPCQQSELSRELPTGGVYPQFQFHQKMCGIFAYLNFLTPRSRKEILDLLIKGLQRLEYRGYDSAGVGLDSKESGKIELVKTQGKVKVLEDEIYRREKDLAFDDTLNCHIGNYFPVKYSTVYGNVFKESPTQGGQPMGCQMR